MKIPSSTYRVQLHKDFTFKDLKSIIPYLESLGVSTIYAAPILKSRTNSLHGYDVVDPHELDSEIGTLDELREIARTLKARNITWLQDIVPNHMAFDVTNWRLMDVLERGEDSVYYNYFDINWDHHNPALKNKLMVPFLGDELEACVKKGEVKLCFKDDGFFICYYNNQYPLSISSYEDVLSGVSEANAFLERLFSFVSGKDYKIWQQHKKKLLKDFSFLFKEFISVCDKINNDKNTFLKILDSQFYKLTYWKRSEKEINYRRFFTVNELICLRMEDDSVFEEYHQFIKFLYDEQLIQGVRIDHIDGLHDPHQYIKRLRKLLGADCYIIAEKILESHESIPGKWEIEGTSGYEFLSFVNQLLTDRQGSKELLSFYQSLVPEVLPYQKLVLENKMNILKEHMHGEWDNLTENFVQLKLSNGHSKDEIKNALAAFMVSLPVYRIYPEKLPLRQQDEQLLSETFQRATQVNQENNDGLNYLKEVLITGESKEVKNVIEFEKRLMQFTGPLTAKGVEDTTFYVYNPLISHDEVGDNPSNLAISVQMFHAKMIDRNRHNPLSLNATATHDTKRGEDARLRVNVLSELHEEWKRAVTEWMNMNASLKKRIHEQDVPSVNDEYFLYQSLVGGYPESGLGEITFMKRFESFYVKALREAKQNSNWSTPNEEYERGCIEFFKAILYEHHTFLQSFTNWMNIVVRYSSVYSLSQVVIKGTCPGIPDIYQGCEFWDLSFVDPDNRRPVDFSKRKQILELIEEKSKEGSGSLLQFLRQNRESGYEKLFVTWRVLTMRRKLNDVFVKGEYIPLETSLKPDQVIAYARVLDEKWVIVVLPLAIARNRHTDQPYASEYNDTRFVKLPGGFSKKLKNIFTDEVINFPQNLLIFDAFKDFPVAVYESQ